MISVEPKEPRVIPGIDPPAPEMLWEGKVLLITYGWDVKKSRWRSAIGDMRKSPTEVKELIGPKQWAKFLQGKREFITHDQALRDWAWLAGVM